jgi:pimeloyl-ACP methyl ester carboxylesterase
MEEPEGGFGHFTAESHAKNTGRAMRLEAFGSDAKQQWIEAAGTRIHTISAGAGETVVLIAGWPQSLWAWRHVFPQMAKRNRVVALDLPGMGDSAIPAPAYDVSSVADIVHATLSALGVHKFFLVGHDIGTWISYPFAAKYRDSVKKLVLMDAVIPGVVPMVPISPQNVILSWHFGFNSIPGLPEALTAGRERTFLAWFFNNRSYVKSAIGEADLDEYERIYTATGAMTSGFNYYRAMAVSAEQNRALSSPKLPMPVLVVAGASGVGARMIEAVVPLCDNARGVLLDGCGHYIPEEVPERLCVLLEEFLGS